MDSGLDDFMVKVLAKNESAHAKRQQKADEQKEKQQSHVKSIQNDTVPVDSSTAQAPQHLHDEYEHDSSDEEDVLNTIGNIPYEWYKDYVHIGYDNQGRKIIKPPREDEIDEFLRKMDDPLYWRTVKDNLTGQNVVLTDNDVDLIKRIKNAKNPDVNYDPYAPYVDFFTYEKMIHPVTNQPETKASFTPSLAEKRIVSKLVSAIKAARLRPKPKVKKDSQFNFNYDLWQVDGEPSKRNRRYIPAPKLKPPGHEESYNPPPEYLFNDEELKEWQEQEEDERKINFIPQKFSSLRQVPGYDNFVKERFDRCLDLYLCPRARKNRINVNPDDLIPDLPKPADLQPFPAIQSLIYQGHKANVTSISIEPVGQFFASGDAQGVVKLWEVLTGRCFKTIETGSSKVINVKWCPNASKSLIAIVTDDHLVHLVNTGIGDKQIVKQTDSYIANFVPQVGEESAQQEDGDDEDADVEDMETDDGDKKREKKAPEEVVEWQVEDYISDQYKQGVRLTIKHKYEIAQLAWHSAGDYFATVMPDGANKSVVIHNLTKRKSQVPFKKSKDIIQSVQFHPTRAYFFVATKKSIRLYDLIKQTLTKKLIVNCNEITCMAIHPKGKVTCSLKFPHFLKFSLCTRRQPDCWQHRSSSSMVRPRFVQQAIQNVALPSQGCAGCPIPSTISTVCFGVERRHDCGLPWNGLRRPGSECSASPRQSAQGEGKH